MSEERAPYGSKADPAELGRVTRNMVTSREAAIDEACVAIRQIERALGKALGGERLLESPNLASANAPVYGYRLRTKEPDRPLRYSELTPTLILSDAGTLRMAWRSDDGVGWREAVDEDLRGADLARLLEILELAMQRHMAKAERRRRRFENIRALADKVTFILGED